MPKASNPRSRSLPPDPSRPDLLSTMMRQIVIDVLKDPLQYPDEMNAHIASFASLNPIQSTSA